MIDDPSTTDMLTRLSAAVVAGAVLGWERRKSRKRVGSRTLIITAIGATGFVMLGQTLAARAADESVQADPTRVLSYIVVGVGFLGGGMIVQRKDQVRGITTGATFWVTAAIGAACGLGEFVLAAMMTTICFATLSLPSQTRGLKSDPGHANNKRNGSSDPEA